MNEVLKPVSTGLIGLAFLFIALQASSVYEGLGSPEPIREMEEFHSSFTEPGCHAFYPDSCDPWKLYWSLQPPSSSSLDYQVLLNRPYYTGGLVAVNCQRQRNLEGSVQGIPGSNFLEIDVSRISVVALNSVEGGKAVATSNIILNPVQYIGGPSSAEMEEKLK